MVAKPINYQRDAYSWRDQGLYTWAAALGRSTHRLRGLITSFDTCEKSVVPHLVGNVR